jgi:hypothetical protein
MLVSGRRDESHLDTYEALRRPAAKQVLQLAGPLTHMATMKSAPERFLRNIALGTINLFPMARRLEMNLSGLSRRAAAELHEGHFPAHREGPSTQGDSHRKSSAIRGSRSKVPPERWPEG